MQDAHEDFEKEHKRLLIAQVVMQDKLEKTQDLVHEIGEKLNGLISWSDQVHRDNNERFKHLEEKQ
jgi:CII-binding regulator of phage lambda lysogenization HflD